MESRSLASWSDVAGSIGKCSGGASEAEGGSGVDREDADMAKTGSDAFSSRSASVSTVGRESASEGGEE